MNDGVSTSPSVETNSSQLSATPDVPDGNKRRRRLIYDRNGVKNTSSKV